MEQRLPRSNLYSKKGDQIDLSIDNLPLYKKIIKDYEFNDIEISNGRIIINSEEQDSYTFKQDYYWMMETIDITQKIQEYGVLFHLIMF